MGSSPKTPSRPRGDYGNISGAAALRSSGRGQRRAGAWLLALAAALAVLGVLQLEVMHSFANNAGAWVAAKRGPARAPVSSSSTSATPKPATSAAAASAAAASAEAASAEAVSATIPPAAPARQAAAREAQQGAVAAVPRERAALAPIPPRALVLATHSRLMWYDPDTDTSTVIHEGEVRPALAGWRAQPAACGRGGALAKGWLATPGSATSTAGRESDSAGTGQRLTIESRGMAKTKCKRGSVRPTASAPRPTNLPLSP
jgi:hypothetical protein